MKIGHEFVEFMPDQLQEGIVYISIPSATVSHNCFCGCGNEVVVPLLPVVGWQLTYDGKSVSFWPSFGNWDLPCESHYIIEKDEVKWCPKWSKEQIERGRKAEQRNASIIFDQGQEAVLDFPPIHSEPSNPIEEPVVLPPAPNPTSKFMAWLKRVLGL